MSNMDTPKRGGSMNVIKLNIIITMIILLCGSLCVAEEQNLGSNRSVWFAEYPVKHESMKELLHLTTKLIDLRKDSLLLWQPDLVQSFEDISRIVAIQECCQQISKPIETMSSLTLLESGHNIYPYEIPALFYIIKIARTNLSSHDALFHNIDELIVVENKFKTTIHSSIITYIHKLKEFARESKRLMQKIVKELEETIKILEAKKEEKDL